jgi:hypothetical protein
LLNAQVVTGRVLQSGTDVAIGDATVFVGDVAGAHGRTLRTRSDGRFRTQLDDAGAFIVRVRRIGFRPFESTELHVAKDDSAIVDVQLAPVPQQLSTVLVNAELDAIKDLRVVGYNARSLPLTYFTPSQIDAAGAGARNYLDIMRMLRVTSVVIDEYCVRFLRGMRCLPVYLDDRFLGENPEEIRQSLFVIDPNAVDHIAYLRPKQTLFELERGGLFIYTREYTQKQRQRTRAILAK